MSKPLPSYFTAADTKARGASVTCYYVRPDATDFDDTAIFRFQDTSYVLGP
ncbi:MAG: hypothetical protein ACR2JU_09250 [Nocardioidaceae bacterium]